jgi:5-methyltetrahydrofolate--homocysteine methyltransferase
MREVAMVVAVNQVSVQDRARRVEALKDLLAQRVVILDGAYGTMLQGVGLTPADYRQGGFVPADHPRDVTGDPDLLNLTRPDVIRDVHLQYLRAGADVITTNTFTATSVGQGDYGLQSLVREMNLAGAGSTSPCRCPRRSTSRRTGP